MDCFVYLLKSLKNSGYYVGITNDLERRLNEHNSKKFHYTSKYAPHKIVWSKRYGNMVDARRHEKWLKKKNKAYKDKLANVSSSPRLEQAG